MNVLKSEARDRHPWRVKMLQRVKPQKKTRGKLHAFQKYSPPLTPLSPPSPHQINFLS